MSQSYRNWMESDGKCAFDKKNKVRVVKMLDISIVDMIVGYFRRSKMQ